MAKSKKFSFRKTGFPFSKTTLVLFLCILIVGFFVGKWYQQQIDSPAFLERYSVESVIGDGGEILAQRVYGFDYEDHFALEKVGNLEFYLSEPRKAEGVVEISQRQCRNGISSELGIGIEGLENKYWCSDSFSFDRFVGKSEPAVFVLRVNVMNKGFESTSINNDDYFRVYYFDEGTGQWKQAVSMTSAIYPTESKQSVNTLIGYKIPKEINQIMLVKGMFGFNSIEDDLVQKCEVYDFEQEKVTDTSCNIVW